MPTTGNRAIRALADTYVTSLAGLDPVVAAFLGTRPGDDRLPDLSPDGPRAQTELARTTLARLEALTGGAEPADGDERRCARLLRERLGTTLAVAATDEHLRAVRETMGPVQSLRTMMTMMPTATEADWAAIARRTARVPEALRGYTASLSEGMARGLLAPPRQVAAFLTQLQRWADAGWLAAGGVTGTAPPRLRAELDRSAAAATDAVGELRRWLAGTYAPRAEGTPDAVGEERYRLLSRQWTGTGLDLVEAYEWGWEEFRRIRDAMREQAGRVLPGASAAEAMSHLDVHGEAAGSPEEIRERLQRLADERIAELDGAHFDIAGPVKVLETRIAPPGSAAAAYYMRPSRDFSRPGVTWLPTLGQTRFPLWKLVTTWHHEGVPGHHLQLAHWVTLAERLSDYQTGLGSVSAMVEGWAVYAERLMDELGYLADPGARLGFLESQSRRAIRVVIDIGMHLRLPIPADWPDGAGQRWTPELGHAFFAAHTARSDAYIASEITRYLARPGQAIGYKLGERAWLAGREAARAAHGPAFDLKAWHMAALSLGALGLADLTDELALI